jgi:hypothetical protein
VTPPAVCHARTLPIVSPAALTSGIGAPPRGSSVTQPLSVRGAAAVAAKAMVTKIIGRMCFTTPHLELGSGSIVKTCGAGGKMDAETSSA